jgi:hypothetical protein
MEKSTTDLTDDIVYALASQALMFDSWCIDKGIGLSKDERSLLTESLLKFAGFGGTQTEINMITLGMLRLNPDYKLEINRDLRKLTGFDETVLDVSRLLNLPERFYKSR